MQMKRFYLLALASLMLATNVMGERRVRISEGWRFTQTDDSLAKTTTYDDSKWEKVTIPHDWSIMYQPSRQAAPGSEGGWYEGGIGWYRTIISPKALSKMSCQGASKYVLYFDGVYQKATVYVNGREAGRHHYGYTPFNIDITSFINVKKSNTIAVKVDNSEQKNCRWYSGSGIYRYVWLKTSPTVRLDSWQTCFSGRADKTLTVNAMVTNDANKACDAHLTLSVDGRKASADLKLASGEKKTITIKIDAPDARLWSPAHPNLYDACLTLTVNGRETDRINKKVGFRTLKWNAEDGLTLNGEPLLVNGACVHHDNGLLGAVATRSTEYRKVSLMKQAGFNLLRTSHNPPSETFLDACDELGMLVIDEAFDGWRTQKNAHDYHTVFDAQSVSDIQSMVRRDAHHPSVIAWSIGNEVIERKEIGIVTTARRLKRAINELDPELRPVTEALCAWDSDWEIYDPHAEVLDIAGYNYMLFKHADDHKRDPKRVIWQTESYPADAFNNWQTTRDYPYVVGDIVWTGLDYLGESGIGGWRYQSWPQGESWQNVQWPWHGAYCGDVDITGLRKPVSYYRDMLWNNKNQVYLAAYEPDGYVEPIKTTMWSTWPTWRSWNWAGWEQKDIDVVVYSRLPKVRLTLNGKAIDEKPTTERERMKAVFRLPYQPGTLVAEGIDENGNVISRDTMTTAGTPSGVRFREEPSPIADADMRYIVVEVIDKDGNLCPQSSDVISVSVNGEAKLLAFGNADLRCSDDIHDNTHAAWHGRALLVLSNKKATVRGHLLRKD